MTTTTTVTITCMRCGEPLAAIDDTANALHTDCRPSVRRSVTRAVGRRVSWVGAYAFGGTLGTVSHPHWYVPWTTAALYLAGVSAWHAMPLGRRPWTGSRAAKRKVAP